ncbi:MAG: hypothetical protein LPK00_05730 [Bacillaceae bacterium]|nr:hypothetical protein [Bacillaceae bacterium]
MQSRKSEDYNNFNYVIDNVLMPVFEQNEEEIEKIFEMNSEFNSRVEKKVAHILKARKLKNASRSESIPKIDKSKEMSGLQVLKNRLTSKNGIPNRKNEALLHFDFNIEKEEIIVETRYKTYVSTANSLPSFLSRVNIEQVTNISINPLSEESLVENNLYYAN